MPTVGLLVHLIQPAVASRPETVEPELLEPRLHAREGHELDATDWGEVGWVKIIKSSTCLCTPQRNCYFIEVG